jgi:small redox-active disulfide protein 2
MRILLKKENLKMLNIKVLGPGCPNCEKLEALCKEVLAENNIQARIKKITDIKRFVDYGLLMTPGLIINEKLVSSGKIPSKSTLIRWINDALR